MQHLSASGEPSVQYELWARLEQLFADAITQPQAARDAFIARSCGADSELRLELEELLRAHDAEGILDSPPFTSDNTLMQPSLASGTCLGQWRIDNMIGRGGMGEVYSATRADNAFEQKAALKLLRYEAVGQMDRFHAERRILAKLEHSGIARLLDGGMAPDGRPYTVMEYVSGQSLTDYCKTQHLSLPKRLALFAQVCDAVAFAHRNLVVHRDLKPDNILVDAQGKVKLLDFGIAKLLDAAVVARDTDHTLAPFTPDYAAPEQLSGQPVTTATDIYTLGVLLFELLTGVRPLRIRGLPSTQALQLLLDRTAPSPSKIAQSSADAPITAKLLTGDLDAIVAKCLRKEPAHRYETVNALKCDIEHHLSNEPVSAREGARLYIIGHLLHRYRWMVAGIAVLIVTLSAGMTGTFWQARRANAQAARANAVLNFVEGLYEGVDPAVTKGESITARELLDRGARRIDAQFAYQTELRAQLKHTMGRLYLKLGLLDRAQDELTAALELTPRADAVTGEARFWRLLDRARLDLAVGTSDAGLAHLDEATALTQYTAEPTTAQVALTGVRAQLLRQRGDDALALEAAAKAYSMATQALGNDHGNTLDAAEAYAELLDAGGRDREALPLLEHIVQIREATLGKDDPHTLHAISNLAGTLSDVDQLPRATALAEDVLERRRNILGEKHPDTALSLFQVGNLWYAAGRYRDADVPLAQAIALLRQLEPTNRNLLATAIATMAVNAYFQGRIDDAERHYREAGALFTALYGRNHRDALSMQMNLAQILRRKGETQKAIEQIRFIVDARAAIGGDTPERADALRFLGDALSAGGAHVEAIERLQEAEQMALRLYGENHEMPQQTRMLLGRAYLNAGNATKAVAVTALALAALEALHPQGHPDVARTQASLAQIELRLGHSARAEVLARLQYDFFRSQFPDAAEAQGLLGECLIANGKHDAGRLALQNAIAVLTATQPQHAQLENWRKFLDAPH
jgi:eukaryotic-like serine/threonine-protein kinase